MSILMKVARLEEIQRHLELIQKSCDSLSILAGTMNAKTTHHCIIIRGEIAANGVKLADEAKEIMKELEEFKKENGL